MSITDRGNVLIIGAGASADFGLPLGGPLLSEVRDELIFQAEQMEMREIQNSYNSDKMFIYQKRTRYHTGKPENDYPIWLWLKENHKKVDGENHIYNGTLTYYRRLAKMMTSVADLLDEQTSETIDDFIAMNPDSADTVKLAIACVFYRIIFSADNTLSTTPKQLHTRKLEVASGDVKKPIVRRNWIHLLINIVRHSAYNGSLADSEKVRIISFNYDGILESVLDSQFGNTGHKFKPWQDYIEIVHPHGWMGKIPKKCDNMKKTIEEWAFSINVVNEKEPSNVVKNARETAASWIQEADEVFMAGFALSRPNAKMLGLGSAGRKEPQYWKIHNFNGSAGLKYLAQSYKNDEIRKGGGTLFSDTLPSSAVIVSFEGGTKYETMSIAQWFQTGIPGEMPG